MRSDGTCRFCVGKVIHCEYHFNDGFHTMGTMLGILLGTGDENDEKLKDGIQLCKGNMLAFESSSGEYESLGVRINYCPLCGRELKEEDTK